MSNQIIVISCTLIAIASIMDILYDVFFYGVTMNTVMFGVLLGLALCGIIKHYKDEDY